MSTTHTELEDYFVQTKHWQKRPWMHLVCTFSEYNDLNTLSLDSDAVLFAGSQNNFDASEKGNTEFSWPKRLPLSLHGVFWFTCKHYLICLLKEAKMVFITLFCIDCLNNGCIQARKDCCLRLSLVSGWFLNQVVHLWVQHTAIFKRAVNLWTPQGGLHFLPKCITQLTEDFLGDRLKFSFSAPRENHRAPWWLSLRIHFHTSHACVRLHVWERTSLCAAALGFGPRIAPLGLSSRWNNHKKKRGA